MLFNSLAFVLFFACIYAGYWLCGRLFGNRFARVQNWWLLLASYWFYGSWDVRFLSLLWLSTAVDFVCGQRIASTLHPQARKAWLRVSLITNLGILALFKYFDFFITSAQSGLAELGLHTSPFLLQVTLPVGVSFYTFQTLSYTIDVYRGQMHPTRRLDDFALYVAFFPQLVAGPIERAATLLPQIAHARREIRPTQVHAGLFLILWGYFKKVVIADHCAVISDYYFGHYEAFRGLDLVIGVLAFTIQIYADFSGYTDIARGLGKLFGIELRLNFKLPYFAASPREFWRRWHVSLSTWLRDYLYISLGGSRLGRTKTLRNLVITMLLGGLWHGAAWHFVVWGGYHAGLLVIEHALRRALGGDAKPTVGQAWRIIRRTLSTCVTFLAISLGWILFRSENLDQAGYILTHLTGDASQYAEPLGIRLLWLTAPLLAMQALQAARGNLLAPLQWRWGWQVLLYSILLALIFVYGVRSSAEFIYFQF